MKRTETEHFLFFKARMWIGKCRRPGGSFGRSGSPASAQFSRRMESSISDTSVAQMAFDWSSPGPEPA